MSNQYERFIDSLREIHDLSCAAALLAWDQEVLLPPKGVTARARQKATLAATIHERMCDDRLGDLVEELSGNNLAPESAANVRVFKRERDRAIKIPKSLVRQITETASLAQQAWVRARQDDDWPLFSPHLEKLVHLKQQEAEAVGYEGEPYNALLDEYEPGARIEDLAGLFADLKQDLTALLEELAASPRQPSEGLLQQEFAPADQDRLGRRILRDIGFDFEAGRLDTSAHPFTEGLSVRDVRITTRYQADGIAVGLYANLHEGGHALYEQGLPVTHEGTPMAWAVSLGIHESQSRLWENCVGRGREFSMYCLPLMKEFFPAQMESADVEDFYRAVNVVRPSLIRIEADEVTYNQHIILRMELERSLIKGETAVADLPVLWRQKMRESLGIEPAGDADGVLQDIHWAFGAFGYFPTYTLGNLYAAHFYQQVRAEITDLPAQIARGEFRPLLAWLREKIHSQGSLHPAGDLCRRVTGTDLRIEPFTAYLRRKFREIYEL